MLLLKLSQDQKRCLEERNEIGIQDEHYNRTNCTYIPQGSWRTGQWSKGIGWVVASALYGGVQLEELGAFKR